MQKIIDTLFWRKSSKVEDRRLSHNLGEHGRQILKMGKHLNVASVPAILNQLLPDKLTGRKKAIDAGFVGSQPFMNVRLRCKYYSGAGWSLVATFVHHVPKLAIGTLFTRFSMRNHVVTRTQKLEIIYVIDDRNTLRLQLPENRR